MKKIAFLVQLPKHVSPGQRFRIEHFEPYLKQNDYIVHTYPFIGNYTYPVLYKRGFVLKKSFGVIAGFIKRFLFLFQAFRYDYIFLQREAAPLGPPVLEWILIKILHKKIILDFDDAIWVPSGSETNKIIVGIKCYWKIRYLCSWSYKISVGNDYLANYARQYNKQVIIIPTCVDTDTRYNQLKIQDTQELVVGWTGSHSTLVYLNAIYPVLKTLQQELNFTFLIICDRPPAFSLPRQKFIAWNEASEIDDLLKINIGIMPLIEDLWSEGKCGFKVIQYMSLGIPAIASAVGVNKKIIQEHQNGFLIWSDEQWYQYLKDLLCDANKRSAMGKSGRERIVANYSVKATKSDFLSLFS